MYIFRSFLEIFLEFFPGLFFLGRFKWYYIRFHNAFCTKLHYKFIIKKVSIRAYFAKYIIYLIRVAHLQCTFIVEKQFFTFQVNLRKGENTKIYFIDPS